MQRWLNRLGFRCEVELRDPLSSGRSRPDGVATIRRTKIEFEVSVTHPLANSYVNGASKTSLSAAHAREEVKNIQHQDHNRGEKRPVYPVVMETLGGVGNSAAKFVDDAIKEGGRAGQRWAPKEVVYGCWRVLSIALVRGNAHIIQAGAARQGLHTHY